MKAEIKETKTFEIVLSFDRQGLKILLNALCNVTYEEMKRAGISSDECDKAHDVLEQTMQKLSTMERQYQEGL
jgi:HKD family nuclease